MAKGSKRVVQPGVWELRVGAGKDPVTGKYLTKQERFRGTERQASKRLAEMVKAVDRAKDAGSPATLVTLSDLLDEWWRTVKGDLSPSTQRTQASVIESTLKPHLGGVPLARLDTGTLNRFYAVLRDRGAANGGPLAAGTVRRIHATLSSALGYAVEVGWIPVNPALKARKPPTPVRDLRPPEPEQVAKLIEASAKVNPLLPLFFRLGAVTGARRSQLCGLRRSDIDYERATITFRRAVVMSAELKHVERVGTKSGLIHTVSLDPATLDQLRANAGRQDADADTVGLAMVADPYVFSFAVDGGQPWRPGYVTLSFERIRDRLGYHGLRLHDFRHYMATMLLASGTDIRTVAGRLGHTHTSTTLNIYAHFMPENDREAAVHMAALL